jgi:predicted glycoside hydrolase/deacetylase ChbG (UPF0249 family)
MLIVNADDIGRCKVATDSALACYRRRRVTSTSAMMFMEDSERAAELALMEDIDVGLHINFCEEFTSDAVSTRLLEYHDRICRFTGRNKYSFLLYDPRLRNHFRYVFQSQYEEFIRLYGRPPSHMDGHKHMHLASNMLFDGIIPCGTKVRRNFTFFPGEKGYMNRLYRRTVDSWLLRRYRLTDYFFGLLPDDAARIECVIRLADTENVELMTHPQVPEQYLYLMSDEYGQAISKAHLGNYNTLQDP